MANNNRSITTSRNAPRSGAMEFVVVRTDNCRFMLTRAEGARLTARLDQWWAPRWVEFVDLHGSLVRLRTRAILEIFDSGPVSRLSESALALALFREDRANDEQLNNSGDE
ncbi:MAG TPA: hypothetical protein PLX31_15940 [Gemmatimonadaceae bacterium]|jgi:hypothetical protein|nr:hypothetical protein [Gemmatimonadota bacterium]MBK9408713.1 hypothetical protein [Gemmatimonadota bacterium]MBK9978107.1 hypothetical protein [Gemmatimonadota bacterium]HNV77095.1 hypothetical protein [Gemmatimonadaceae bacterium]HPV76397.1 hypothetical protein [Gemmatimonadaceae bacterium]